jgi:hypothetical protein
MPGPQTTLAPTTEYLRACYERDKQFASEANLRAVQVSVDIMGMLIALAWRNF